MVNQFNPPFLPPIQQPHGVPTALQARHQAAGARINGIPPGGGGRSTEQLPRPPAIPDPLTVLRRGQKTHEETVQLEEMFVHDTWQRRELRLSLEARLFGTGTDRPAKNGGNTSVC
jgi:hypothetical protein